MKSIKSLLCIALVFTLFMAVMPTKEAFAMSSDQINEALQELSQKEFIINMHTSQNDGMGEYGSVFAPDADDMLEAIRLHINSIFASETFFYGYDGWHVLMDGDDPADFNDDTWEAFVGLNYQAFIGNAVLNHTAVNNLLKEQFDEAKAASPYVYRNKVFSPRLEEDQYVYELAITDIVASYYRSDSPNHEIEINGITYELFGGLYFYEDDELDYKELDDDYPLYEIIGTWEESLNSGVSGAPEIYLYVTRDERAGNPITNLYFEYETAPQVPDLHSVLNTDGYMQDFNYGTGDDSIWLYVKHSTYSKAQYKEALEAKNGQTGSIFGNTNTILIAAGVIVIGSIIVIATKKKAKKS